jgi:hypothetical protein
MEEPINDSTAMNEQQLTSDDPTAMDEQQLTSNDPIAMDEQQLTVDDKKLNQDYLDIKNDERWTSIVKILHEAVQNDVTLEIDIQKAVEKANRKNDSSNIRLKDTILMEYPDIGENPELKSKSSINVHRIIT